MSGNAKLKKINSRIIGTIFALTLLIPSNIGIDFYGINFEDLPLIFVFFYLLFEKVSKFEIKKFDRVFFIFIFFFILYTTNPLIRDLIIEGLSLARTQKEEFSSILNSNDGDINALFKTLENFSKN